MQTSFAKLSPAASPDAGFGDMGKPVGKDTGAGDAFSQALASLMSVLGQATPTPMQTTGADSAGTAAVSLSQAPVPTTQGFSAASALALPPQPEAADDGEATGPASVAAGLGALPSLLAQQPPAAIGSALGQPKTPPAKPDQPQTQSTPAPDGAPTLSDGPASGLLAMTANTVPAQPTLDETQPPGTPALTTASAIALAAPPIQSAKAAPMPTASGKTSDKSGIGDDETAPVAGPVFDKAQAVVAQAQPADANTSDQHDGRGIGEPDTRTSSAAASNDNGADGSNGTIIAPAATQQAASVTQATAPPVASQLATQVVKNVQGKSTRFDVALEPAGMGRVDVKVQIDAGGQVTAQFSFASPHAAAEARTQAGQLQQALEQAGFNVAQGGLSFDVGVQGAGSAQQDAAHSQPTSFAAATASVTADVVDTLPAAAIAAYRSASGLDITI